MIRMGSPAYLPLPPAPKAESAVRLKPLAVQTQGGSGHGQGIVAAWLKAMLSGT